MVRPKRIPCSYGQKESQSLSNRYRYRYTRLRLMIRIPRHIFVGVSRFAFYLLLPLGAVLNIKRFHRRYKYVDRRLGFAAKNVYKSICRRTRRISVSVSVAVAIAVRSHSRQTGDSPQSAKAKAKATAHRQHRRVLKLVVYTKLSQGGI